jgi:uncharacterized phage protein (TIGR02220 family)
MSLFDIQKTEAIEAETVSDYELIINHLNSSAGTCFKSNGKSVKGWIDARLKDGFTVEDFYHVHAVKVMEWTGTEYEKYLRPQTLYRPDNFQAYLNQKVSKKDKSRMLSKMLSDQGVNVFDIYEGGSNNQLLQLGMCL